MGQSTWGAFASMGAGGKSKKKKWAKGKVKEKLANMVQFDKATYDKMMKEIPKAKLITPSVVPEPCLYCQLKCEETDAAGDDEDKPDIPELRFVPNDPNQLQNLFMVFSEMSAMNPDLNDDQANDDSSEDSDLDDPNINMQIGAPPAGMMGMMGAGGA